MNIYDNNEKVPKHNKGKVKDFFRKQGFYVALFVCIALIGLTALLAINWENQEKDASPTDQSVQNIESEDLANATSPSPSPSPSSSVTDNSESTSTTPSFTLTIPVNGEIINQMSTEKLVFNETLNQWSTHNGIDIKGDEGAEVLAAMNGTVESVSQDDLYGYVIKIKHDSDIETVYIGAKPMDGIEEGSKVNAGQQIGTLTNPIFEKHLNTHLHFEVILNGEYLNPEEYFSE